MRKRTESASKRHLRCAGGNRLVFLTTVVAVCLVVATGATNNVCEEDGECFASDDTEQKGGSSSLVYWTANEYPSLYASKDGNAKRGYQCHPPNAPQQADPRICDPDGVLTDGLLSDANSGKDESSETLAEVWTAIRLLEVMHSNVTAALGCHAPTTKKEGQATEWGLQVAVAIVKKMDLSRQSSKSEDPETDAARDFAIAVHNKWGVGETIPKCGDTGIVLFFSVYDRAMYISTGSAIRRVLTTQRLNVILDTMKGVLQRGQFDGAIHMAVLQIHDFLEQGPPSFRGRILQFLSDYSYLVIFLILLRYNVVTEEYYTRQYAQVKSELSRLDRDRALALQGRYRCMSCPICFGDFQEPSNTTAQPASSGLDDPQPEREQDDNEEDAATTPTATAAQGGVASAAASESTPVAPSSVEQDSDTNNNGAPSSSNNNDKNATVEENEDDSTPDDEALPTHGSDGLPLKRLQCGHVFDQTCWCDWVQQGTGNGAKCPVCKHDVGSSGGATGNNTTPDNRQPAAPEVNNNNDNDNNSNRPRHMALFERERNFRLARLARLHPRWIRPEDVARWTHHAYNGQMAQDPQFILRDPSGVGAFCSSCRWSDRPYNGQTARGPHFFLRNPSRAWSSSSSSGSRSGGGGGFGGFGGGGSAGGAGGRW